MVGPGPEDDLLVGAAHASIKVVGARVRLVPEDAPNGGLRPARGAGWADSTRVEPRHDGADRRPLGEPREYLADNGRLFLHDTKPARLIPVLAVAVWPRPRDDESAPGLLAPAA